jgi:predicted RNase H-like nuclease (RuvC/YqgF family)
MSGDKDDYCVMAKLAEKAPSWFTRVLLPEISEIKGELRAINARIDSTNTKIDALDNKVEEVEKRLSIRIDEMDKRLSSKVQGLRELVNLTQRVTILEVKQRESEKKA